MSGGIIISDKLGEDGAVVLTLDWPVALTLDWLVATRLDVTINVSEAELDPWVATTWTNPTDDDKGTVKLAKNSPLLLVVTVVKSVSLNVIRTFELGSNPAPVIFTEVPTGSEVELSVMVGATEDVSVNDEFDDDLAPWVALGFTMSVTLNVFETELDSWLALTIWSPFEDVEGTLKVVLNAPLDGHVAVTLLSPWKLITIGDEGLNPFPVTVTKLALGPEVGLIVMTGLLEVDFWFFSEWLHFLSWFLSWFLSQWLSANTCVPHTIPAEDIKRTKPIERNRRISGLIIQLSQTYKTKYNYGKKEKFLKIDTFYLQFYK
jgi:hypothetical protein